MWEDEIGLKTCASMYFYFCFLLLLLTRVSRLLHWVQSKIPDLPIANFTTDWNDGRAVGALVDAVAPGKPELLIRSNFHFQLHNLTVEDYTPQW